MHYWIDTNQKRHCKKLVGTPPLDELNLSARESALQQWYALVQHILGVPRPDKLTDEDLATHISRVKWLFKHKFIYGIELTMPKLDKADDEEQEDKTFEE